MKTIVVIVITLFLSSVSFSQMNPFDSLRMVNVPYNREMIKKTDLIKVEKSIIDLINSYRKSQGKNVLTYNFELSDMSREWSDSLVNGAVLSENGGLIIRHTTNPYVENCYGKASYEYYSKLKPDYFYIKTPKSVYNAWYNSKGHNAGMLMGGTEIGVGLSYGIRDDGGMFCVATMLIK
jgi:uncharacterized protein YkwD